MHKKLEAFMTTDGLEYQEARGNTTMVEAALKKANGVQTDSVASSEVPNSSVTDITGDSGNAFSHPVLQDMDIEEAHKAALEDLQEAISVTQQERELATLSSNADNITIPFNPPRAVEEMVGSKHHRIWQLGNINLLAPILIATWRLWTGLTPSDLDLCKEAALQNNFFVRGSHDLLQPFNLALFDHKKCTSDVVRIHAKNDLDTGKTRKDRYLTEMWNPLRPYFRCSCSNKAPQGTCQGSILWLDHCIYFMINHLEKFFPDERYPTLKTKFFAFCI